MNAIFVSRLHYTHTMTLVDKTWGYFLVGVGFLPLVGFFFDRYSASLSSAELVYERKRVLG